MLKAKSPLISQPPTAEPLHDTEPDLSIFNKYAHRVRTLDVSGQLPGRSLRRYSRYPDVTDDLGALLYYSLPTPLLPNLKHLVWAPTTSLTLLRHLLSPHLLSLKIPNNHWVPESSLFALTKIPALCPKIKSLTLQIRWLDPPMREPTQPCISGVICSWEKLEELDCIPMTTEGVLCLSVLSSLKILRLQVTTQSVTNLPCDSLSFPSLHTLEFQTDTLETAIALLRAMDGLPKSLKIDVCAGNYRRGRCSRESLGVLLRLVGDASQCELRNFSMNFPFLLGDDPVNVYDMLRPLFQCCELRTLCIRMTSRFTLGDDDLRMMAAAWPQLEELELVDLRPRPRVVTPSPPPLQPQPPVVAMGPGQPTQLPQPPPPLFAAGPAQVPQPQIPLPAGAVQAPQPQTTLPAGAVQAHQPQNPQPQVFVHMNPHPFGVPPPVNPGQLNQFQHLPVLPPPFPAAFPIAFANHSVSVRSRTAEITFHGLISLLELCPNLYYFDLAIDATKLDDLQGQNPGGGVCNRLIKGARLIDSPIENPARVARILLDILPELDDFLGSNTRPLYPPHNIAPQGWLAVRQMMHDSRHARMQLTSGG